MKKGADASEPPSHGDYEVGYGRPPKHKQFVPGTSGNPKGRPKGRKNIATIITEMAMQPMIITEGGRRRTVPRMAALMLTMWAEAFKGNPKAWVAVLQGLREVGSLQAEAEGAEQPLSDDDHALISDYLKKVAGVSKQKTPTTKTTKKPEPKAAPKKKE
jgi:hypothetical protein